MPSRWGSNRVGGRRARGGRQLRDDRGSVTAELAMVLPAVVLVLGCCLAAVQVAGQQVRLTDAAADAARALSRGDEAGRAAGLVTQAVSGASLGTENRGEFICAHLSAPSAFGPFALFGLTIEASSCALADGL